MDWCMRHGNVPSRLYSALCVVTTLRLVDPPKASSQWISYVERENIPRYIHTKWGAQIVDPHGNIQHLIADGGLHYLPAVTDDSHMCDDSSTQRRPKGLGTFHSYRTSAPGRSLLSPTNSRLGTCDDDGFTQVLRGPKPQQQVAPRAYTQQSRFLPLSDSTDVPAAADTTVDVDDTPMPTSYAVQTRRMAQKAEDSLPTKLTESHKTPRSPHQRTTSWSIVGRAMQKATLTASIVRWVNSKHVALLSPDRRIRVLLLPRVSGWQAT